jgi:hypothetical protein
MPDSVTRLNLGNCGLTSEGIKLLCEHIKTNTSITDLFVWGNKFGDKGAKYIADMLRVNKSLPLLNITRSAIGPRGFEYLASALTVNNTLRSLPLHSDPDIGDEHIWNLCRGLKDNHGLEALSFEHSPGLSSEGIGHIVDCLRSNHYLTAIAPVGPHYWREAWPEMYFFLELNKLNRKIVKDEEAPLSDWLDSVIQAANKHNDVGYSYFFLRNKPELCMHAHNAGA